MTWTDHEISRALGRVDWDFTRSTTDRNSVHALHWFPGNFLPQIPFFLVQALSGRGETVLDPFAGAGTTGVEALKLGRKAWMSDLSRASVQVMLGKIGILSGGRVQTEMEKFLADLAWDHLMGAKKRDTRAGSAPGLTQWYAPHALSHLQGLWGRIERVEDQWARCALELIFTDTLFACAATLGARTSTGKRRRHHWGWVADNVLPRPPLEHDVGRLFRDRCTGALRVARANPIIKPDYAVVRRMNAMALEIENDSVDLVVTSPPYLNMIDYTMANRLTSMWMGWDVSTDRQHEIGARYKRQRMSSLTDYEDQLQAAWQEILRVLKPGGLCAIMLGNSVKQDGLAERLVTLFRDPCVSSCRTIQENAHKAAG